jgi:hypothetical protein
VASPGAAIAGGNLCYGVARNAAVKISRISKRCRGIVYSSVSGAVLADLLCAVSGKYLPSQGNVWKLH